MRALIALLLIAAAPADVLTIGGEVFAQSEIVDARAVADATGAPAVMVSFTAKGKARLNGLAGKPVAVGPVVYAHPVVADGSVEISGGLASFEAAAALAMRISGKVPLPESEGE